MWRCATARSSARSSRCDPPLYAFVPDVNEELAEQRRVLQDSMATGGPDAAIEAWLAGRADPAALARAKASHKGFFADYAGLASWPVTRGQLRSLTIPVTVVTSPSTPWHVARAADAIAALVPLRAARTTATSSRPTALRCSGRSCDLRRQRRATTAIVPPRRRAANARSATQAERREREERERDERVAVHERRVALRAR